jgi:outer membrane protein assembly factor BamD (BamD/ComL family)
MARRDKYQDYRDVIYYMAAQMELERNNLDAAEQLLLKGVKYNNGNNAQRNKAYLQLADMAYVQKRYPMAHNFYDSLDLSDRSLVDTKQITDRKELLKQLVDQLEIIQREDSLQRIAKMPEEERKDFIKKLVKHLRKEKGLKDEDASLTSGFPRDTPSPDLFNTTQTKGEWYFYNTSLRTKGQVEFKGRWGNRPNVDNWRRISAVTVQLKDVVNTTDVGIGKSKPAADQNEISYEALYNNIPLTAEQLTVSDQNLQNAMYELGKIYVSKLEDCQLAIETFEKLNNRFPHFEKMDEVLFNLYYCYNKSGQSTKAEETKNRMKEAYLDSKYTTIVVTGKNPESKTANPEATKIYEGIYDLFIEGKFGDAVEQKKHADSVYGKNYWTPQLLYIEAVYDVKQRLDSLANIALSTIISQYPEHPLAAKASNLKRVLARRAQIEDELNKLQVERPIEDSTTKDSTRTQTAVLSPVNQTKTDSVSKTPAVIKRPVDTLTKKPPLSKISSPFTHIPDAPHNVVVILNKVDVVFGNEAKNAFFRYNREKFYNQPLQITTFDADADNKLLLIGTFANAQAAADYVEKTKPLSGTEIIPWLKGDKYTFSIISDKNLELLKTNPDLVNYKKFIDQYFPGKF